MSYSIRLGVVDGRPVVEDFSGQVPEATFLLSGHECDSSVTIGVSRHEGTTVIVQASGSAKRG